MFHVFFLKISSYQSTPKNPYVQLSSSFPPSLANFAQCHLHQNIPLWQIICDDDTAFSRGWRRSGTGDLIACTNMKPELGVQGLPVVEITP